MTPEPRLCVLIPVYNHELTVQRVALEAGHLFPVIVVDDGSTDQTPSLLATTPGITLVRLARNCGKAAALRAGFMQAEQMGFTHVITMDADGQHPTSSLARFAARCQDNPRAFIIGVRDLKAARAPRLRRFSNAISAFWFRLETGLKWSDSQCGYRIYPLAALKQLATKSQRYAFELEVMIKAAWAGFPLLSEPVEVDYSAVTSRLSHFHPLRDLGEISLVHWRMALQAFWSRRMHAMDSAGKR
jgi:glycosyltransferase involved in cell wall biosynthesis